MPRRTDIKKILVIGSGPIVIGQACEFDYSGTQAIRALKEEGYQVILINSNPATIMTDPKISDRVYLEPLTLEFVTRILELEKPDAILPTMGGQTALNLAIKLHHAGVMERLGIRLLGANIESIRKAEDRELFKKTMAQIGVEVARSFIAKDLSQVDEIIETLGLPVILRPSFTLGGEGGGIAQTREELLTKIERALFLSPSHDVLVEESLLGWKEYELEVVRDHKDNVIIVCSIENFDPMGVHTGDSVTVAPAMTLTDREFQNLRDQSIRIIRAIGVETGGSNIQFAVHPDRDRVVCIEMNPRVSRSSALASKATGFPIARVAAKLAVGYSLDELTNEITQSTPSSFEPSIDYVVTKIPRFDFEKFRPSSPTLSTQMKSVGEVMALGRTFEESLAKALVGLEVSAYGLVPLKLNDLQIEEWLRVPNPNRLLAAGEALRRSWSVEKICALSKIDSWFIRRMQRFLEGEKWMQEASWPFSKDLLQSLKTLGWTDRGIARFLKLSEEDIRQERVKHSIFPAYLSVDTCAAEFEAKTPYFYSSYRGTNEVDPSDHPKVMVLGSGPNRIGQGIEFDYCCVHASMALREMGIETIMVNSNPETVSTDFDVSDRLYFEPLTPEHVLNIARIEKPLGVLVQFGGQTPLKIAHALEKAGLKILGTSTNSIDLAEDRQRFDSMVKDLKSKGLLQPPSALATTREEVLSKAEELGFPLLVRPSYVLGGRAMRIVHRLESLDQWIEEAIEVSENHPILLDRFLNRAIEVDVDALCDGRQVFIAGIMEHIEEAGVHSGDSSCSLPPFTLPQEKIERIREYTRELGLRLEVRGLMNIQFAIQGDDIYVLEVNPRASRTIPFISKSTGVPLVSLAIRIVMGQSLKDLGIDRDLDLNLKTFNIKAPVFPFDRFPESDILLGPEMKSTGEVMGRGHDYPTAYAKALRAAGMNLPKTGEVFMSIRDEDKEDILPIARRLIELGFQLCATRGTASFLKSQGLKTEVINKVAEGSPHCVEAISSGRFALVINTTSDEQAIKDSFSIRRATLERKIPYATIASAAKAMVQAIEKERSGPLEILPL